MTTPTAVQERTGQHEELLALIALLLPRLTRTWQNLGTAQDVLLRTLPSSGMCAAPTSR